MINLTCLYYIICFLNLFLICGCLNALQGSLEPFQPINRSSGFCSHCSNFLSKVEDHCQSTTQRFGSEIGGNKISTTICNSSERAGEDALYSDVQDFYNMRNMVTGFFQHQFESQCLSALVVVSLI